MASPTLYWHDYETLGRYPRVSRPSQFAGVRTDEELNEIEDPLVLYCKPPQDQLPDPEAALITSITPQLTQQRGVIEYEFARSIFEKMSLPGTCGVGYNSLRFDDEVTRHLLYRNLYDPYSREWKDGNSRWDIIDLARMTHDLRPEGIKWPQRDGRPSFKLEALTAENNIPHTSAHDALSDVRATIGLAKILKKAQPRLYDWYFSLRFKREVEQHIDLKNHAPLLHTSGMYSSESGCTALVVPLVVEHKNKNSYLVYDLRHDPSEFINLDVETLRYRLFTSTQEMGEGVNRLPVKSIKINKSPAIAPQNILDKRIAKNLDIDFFQSQLYRKKILSSPSFIRNIASAYSSNGFDAADDVDQAIYSGFFGNHDKALCEQVRTHTPQELASIDFDFQDKRLPELLFRYRARNWPESLSAEETVSWRNYCINKFKNREDKQDLNYDAFVKKTDQLSTSNDLNEEQRALLDDLSAWVVTLMDSLEKNEP
ncbi:MAG: exodeoxyribonuclease I [Acidiferrobacteraceae bacterium]|nr:exodeoxyribonuclease I [Acidiferrobacteraceae bacterium]